MKAIIPSFVSTNIPSSKSSYKPEIDGLRALAVIAVIINHFSKEALPSGYLGVDIFFVISGFVITSSLAGRSNKNFGDFLLGFYTRRIKRLVPALVLFVVVTSVLICLFNPNPETSLKTGLTALFGFSNLYLLRLSTDYFATSTELNVFTHTWSLGVEEQFYFLFPFLVWFTGFSRLTAKGSKNLFWVILTLSVASLVTFVFLYPKNPSAAYFLMPCRLWELGTGCLLFLCLKHSNRFLSYLKKLPPLLITGAIVAVLFVPLQFAVPATIAVVIMTAILIACLRSGTGAYILFTRQEVVYIGLISYSLYLWHWGILALSRWTIGIHWWSIPLQIGLLLVLSMASHYYVETPLRHANWSTLRWKSIAYGIIVSASAAFILMILLVPLKGLIYTGKNISQYVSENNPEVTCQTQDKNNPKFMIVGDSHARQLKPLFASTSLKCRTNAQTVSEGLFPQLVSSLSPNKEENLNQKKVQELSRETDKINNQYQQKIKSLTKGDVLVVSSRYLCRLFTNCFSVQLTELYHQFFDDNLQKINEKQAQELYLEKLSSLGEELNKKGVKILVMLPLPEIQQSPYMCHREWFRPYPASGCSVAEETYQTRQVIVDRFRQLVASSKTGNIFLYDGFSLICGSTKDCKTISDDPSLMNDPTHISFAALQLIYQDFLSFLVNNNLIK